MDAWIIDILKSYGLAGVVIFGLVGVVIRQSGTIKGKDADLTALHAQRAAEREKLAELLAGVQEAQRITAEVTAKRNEIMEDWAMAMVTQANANDRLGDKVANQAEMFKQKLGDFKHVVDSFGESNRVVTGILSEIRNLLIAAGVKIDAMPAAISTALNAAVNAGHLQGRAP
jgi:hypothetical protein